MVLRAIQNTNPIITVAYEQNNTYRTSHRAYNLENGFSEYAHCQTKLYLY